MESIFRECCISVGNDPSYQQFLVLFDTGAHPSSYVNREVAEWIQAQALTVGGDRQQGKRVRGADTPGSIALAGTSMSCPTYGSVVFNLTFLNEVTGEPETLFALDAKIIDSCIDIIISRQVIRKFHLIKKIPHYFDEPNRSAPNRSQSVEPVTLPSTKTRSVGAQLCATCTPFAEHGYDNTLCSLAAARTDRFQVPPKRSQRPHARAFAHPPPVEGMQLIDKSELLDPVADDDDIE